MYPIDFATCTAVDVIERSLRLNLVPHHMRRAIVAACLAFAIPAHASPLDAMVRSLEAGRDRLAALEASEGLCEDRPDCIAQWSRAGLDHERIANHRRTIRACRAGSSLDCAYVKAWDLRWNIR